jgi:chemotaxis protein methyltransferase WspC
MSFELVRERLRRAIGLDPQSLGPAGVQRAVERRLEACGLTSAGEYDTRLERSPEELRALVEEVVVGESWFFRHPHAFELLKREAHRVMRESPEHTYRALSLPCAGGEEPYSIAIALLEAGLHPGQFTVDAGDISHRALERARAGVYGGRHMRPVSELQLRQYFQARGELFEVSPQARESVRLVQANVLDGALLPFAGPYDAIFCRNLLIYLDGTARRSLIETLGRLLAPRGLLFVGHAEGLPELEAGFARCPEHGTFAYRRRTQPANIPDAPPRKPSAGRLSAPRPTPRPPARTTRVKHPPAKETPAALPDLLEQASALANEKRFEEAIALCERQIRTKGPSAGGYYALGMIHQAAGDAPRAEQALERSVYLDGKYEDALLALALLAHRRGDEASAQRYRQRASRARGPRKNT